jgi:integrase
MSRAKLCRGFVSILLTGGSSARFTVCRSHVHSNARDALRLPADFVVYSLRHTYGTRLGESAADAFSIMRLMGHSSVTVSQRYVHPTPETLERAVDRLQAMNAKATAMLETGAKRSPTTVFTTVGRRSHRKLLRACSSAG